MLVKITEKLLKSATTNPQRGVEYRDQELTGFHFTTRLDGTANFFVQSCKFGTSANSSAGHRRFLGVWPSMSLKQARDKAERMLKAAERTPKPSKRLLSDKEIMSGLTKTRVTLVPEQFQIRYDIPFEGSRNVYPFDKMEVGGCIEVDETQSRKIRNAAYQFAKKINKTSKHKIAFALRKSRDDAHMFRLWRIK